MKAVVFQAYGSSEVLQTKDVPVPGIGEGDVLVTIRAAGANPHDWRSMRGDPSLLVRILLGLRKPRRATVLGSDMSAGWPSAAGGLARHAQLLEGILLSPFVSQRIVAVAGKANKEDLQLRELIEAGQVTPVIDRTYPLDQAPEAIRYLEEGHARGKVVVAIGDA